MVSLFHRDLGGSGRPPLVLLHGMLGSSRNWQTAGRDLAERWHVLAPDLRNHGLSPHHAEMNYPAMVADVIAWMDAVGLGRADLMGHSMGGKVAMLLACRHPERVAALTVVDIAPRAYFWVGHRASFAAMNELNLSELRSRADAELRFEARVASFPLRKFLATNLERTEDGAWRWQINLPALSAALPDLEGNSLGAGDIFAGPVRFIAGGQSSYIEPDDHAVIRRHFPAARIDVIPKSGHNPHMETRADFVRLVVGS